MGYGEKTDNNQCCALETDQLVIYYSKKLWNPKTILHIPGFNNQCNLAKIK